MGGKIFMGMLNREVDPTVYDYLAIAVVGNSHWQDRPAGIKKCFLALHLLLRYGSHYILITLYLRANLV